MKTTQILIFYLLVISAYSKKRKLLSHKETTTQCVQDSLLNNGGSIFTYNGKTYIRLVADNYSGYQLPERNPWVSEAEPNAVESSINTIWKAVQIDLNTMTINTGDFTFSQSTGHVSHHSLATRTRMSFGSAFGCESGEADGQALVDLRGTPFAVDTNWVIGGWQPIGNAVKSSNDQVVTISGGGYCGWNVPQLANDAGEEVAHLGGPFLKVKLIECLNSITLTSCGNFYINLSNPNFSGYKVPDRKPWGVSDSDVVTTWNKVRFNPKTLRIDTSDYLFTTSVGQCNHHKENNYQVPYGSAFGCQNSGIADGKAKIDLTGTPFKVTSSFEYGGWEPTGTVVVSNNGQIIDILGGGYCGWMVPSEANIAGETVASIGGNFITVGLI